MVHLRLFVSSRVNECVYQAPVAWNGIRFDSLLEQILNSFSST